MIHKAIWLEYQAKSRQPVRERHAGLSSYQVRQWCYLIGLPVVGLLALVFCLWLGGAFALVGPWIIFIAVRVITKRLHLDHL